MANTNNNTSAEFAQSKLYHELINFFEHIKKSYPDEQKRVNNLAIEISKLDYKTQDTLSLDDFDNLHETLSKAKALSVAALNGTGFVDLDGKTINDYLWALNDLIINAQQIIAQYNS